MAAMAVQMQLSRASPPPIASLSSWPTTKYSTSTVDLLRSSGSVDVNKKKGKGVGVRVIRVRSSLEMAGPVVGQVTEVNKDTFWPLVKAAADKTVVLDMYTQWYLSIYLSVYGVIFPATKHLVDSHFLFAS